MTEPQDVLMSDPEINALRYHFGDFGACTGNISNKLHHVDDCLNAVTGGIDQDDENEDAGNINIPSLSLTGVR